MPIKPISAFIQEAHLAGWAHVAVKNGAASVDAYAQQQLDNLGATYERERKDDDAREQQRLFDIALTLSEESRLVLKDTVIGLAASEGKLPEGMTNE